MVKNVYINHECIAAKLNLPDSLTRNMLHNLKNKFSLTIYCTINWAFYLCFTMAYTMTLFLFIIHSNSKLSLTPFP